MKTDAEIIDVFEKAGMTIEIGTLYSVKGQIGQLLNGVKKLLIKIMLKQNDAYNRGWNDAKAGKKGQQCNHEIRKENNGNLEKEK